jgi:hypothetical protein
LLNLKYLEEEKREGRGGGIRQMEEMERGEDEVGRERRRE